MAVRAVAVLAGIVLVALLAIGLAAALRSLLFVVVGLGVGFVVGWIVGRTSRADDREQPAAPQRRPQPVEPPAVEAPVFDPRKSAEEELARLKRELEN